MLKKYARAEILEVKGSKERIKTAGLDHMSDYSDYRTDDGFLYTRVRAISSRVNKNHDGWPSEELAKAYMTFLGKPIFVDHHNSDPGKARGVIVDAKLHIENDMEKASALDSYYSSAPENHKPPTWVELLLEVDAKAYPHLAAAIINDEIDGVSMGANVERSRCSHCGNWATAPEEYCQHIRNKGALFDYSGDTWDRTSAVAKASYEDCYDIGFFEISYVFDPADETALVSEVRASKMSKTAGDQLPISDLADPTPHGAPDWDTWAYQQGQQDAAMDADGEGIPAHTQMDFTGHEDAYIKGYIEAGGDPMVAQEHVSQHMSKTAATKKSDDMSMGGLGGAMDSGVPQQPALPGANDQNCPTCGTAMQDGSCPNCTTPGMDPNATAGGDPNSGMMGPMMSHIANDGTVHYADYDESNTADLMSNQEVQGLSDSMGLTPTDIAQYALTHQPEHAQAVLQHYFPDMSPEDIHMELAAAEMRDMGVDPSSGSMPADPFLSRFKLASDGTVHYAGYRGDDPDRIADEIHMYIPDYNAAVDQYMARLEAMGMPVDEESAAAAIEGAKQRAINAMHNTKPFIDREGKVHYAQPDLPQSMMTVSPEKVNTLRQEKVCDICGSDMDDGKCDVCNYEEPPEGFDNPDLQKAQEIAQQGAEGQGMPPGVMEPGAGGGPGMPPTPGPGGPPPAPPAGGNMATSSTSTGPVTTERTAGKIKGNEKPILPATKTVSDHPKTTTVVTDTNRLVKSHTTKENMTIPTKSQVVAQMVSRGTAGVKTAAEAEALLEKSKLLPLLAADAVEEKADHPNTNVDQVGGEYDNPEGGVTHENVEKEVDIEKIPTMTWSDGKGDSLGQESPVTSETANDLGGPIGTAVSRTTLSDIFPGTDTADKQIDVEKPLQPEFTKGPETMTWSGGKGDSLGQENPVTTENANQVGGPIGEAMASRMRTHIFSALKVAEDMIELGLVPEEKKFELATELEQESPEQLQTRSDMLARTKTAGLAKAKPLRRAPSLTGPRTAHANTEITDQTLGDSALFS